ncbi:uncharacterized protein LOC131246835 isoform X2 [Magnolia sinica]|uniref:uncharacterized protein LOC131246835 isoform X2 n=1 Tax=Magnolia sinica TaxID=86752 RepID=UPI00265A7189|nr:uncharacterized protein LOC131246835 isoform X2 [Magnolia sinica]
MGSESINLEERLKSLLIQLQTELGILDRIVYKGKNQHRRCLYFQYLLKVRRDVKLLLLADLEGVLSVLFQVINGKKPTQKVHHLERLKKQKHHNRRHNFQERLLGVARLLSQMVEPMLKASIQISSLLAQSFFMGFSLTNLAILARLRVLVQQVFREYHPPSGDFLTLECVWEGDKFVLHEMTNTNKRKNQDEDLEEGRSIPLGASTIQYQSIEISYEDDELAWKKVPTTDSVEEGSGPIDVNRTDAISIQSIEMDDDVKTDNTKDGDNLHNERSPHKDSTVEGSGVGSISPFLSPPSLKPQAQPTNNVAFVSVRKSAPSESNGSRPHKKMEADRLTGNAKETDDPFFSLLMGGSVKDSLF